MNEDDIMHEAGWFWVGREPDRYTVYRAGITHSVSDSSYRKNAAGLSLAVARCDYLSRAASKSSSAAVHLGAAAGEAGFPAAHGA